MGDRNQTLIISDVEDRLTNLPESLIVSILERLPIQDAVRTSILSENWRYKHTTMTTLVFDEEFSKKFAKNGAFGHNGFIRIINRVMFFHKGSILKFYLHIPDMCLDSFQEVDQWMLFLSRNGVREFHLMNTNQRYELPSYVFSCLELRTLKLDNCLFKPPLKFDGFFKLENLNLRDINFVASSFRTHINLPQLKSLTLTSCTNLYNFNIKATKLQILRVGLCPGAMLLRLLMHGQRIFLVSVLIESAIQDIVQVERINLTRILSNLPKTSIFNGYFLKLLIAEKIPKWLPHPVNCLKSLGFISLNFGDLDQLQGALCLLRNSPNLEKLRICNVQREPQLNDSDARPVLNYLESPDGLDQTLNLLKIVEIENIEGSRPELHFIKLLLAHSPSLVKFTIHPWGTSLSNKVFNIAIKKKDERFNIAKDVMQFPRASQKAEMIFLDPEP